MNFPDYSVTIRTLGTAGTKFEATLNSIANQTLPPKEVFVVIPDGYLLPKLPEWATVIRSEKGMVIQRIIGIEAVTTDYTMALDDDVEFGKDFAEQLMKTSLENGNCFVSPCVKGPSIIAEKKEHPNSRIKYLFKNRLKWMGGVNWETKFDDDYILKIANTGGFVCDNHKSSESIYKTQSGHGTIMFGPTTALKSVDFRQELWLEGCQYAWPDDQVEYYKLFINGYTLLYAPFIELRHLDAGTSITGEKKQKIAYSAARNAIIFWHRFIYLQRQKKVFLIFAISRRIIFSSLFALCKSIVQQNFNYLYAWVRGYWDGFRFIKSKDYKKLTDPICTKKD